MEQRRQVADVRMAERCPVAREHEQPGLRALGGRRLGDQLGRQRVVEVGKPHRAGYGVRPPAARNGRRMSIGTGKIVVELFSVAISASVCR